MKKYWKGLFSLALAVVAVGAIATVAMGARDDGTKGVICHATGSDGNPFVGIIVGIDTSTPLTIFSNNGHLDASGSPLSGHEQDKYIGPSPPNEKQDCDELPPPSPDPSPTS